MFDDYARQLIDQLPRLPELDPVACRRALSRAYLLVVNHRVRAAAPEDDGQHVREELRRMTNALESVAVFDPLKGITLEPETCRASAFVAAEALALVAELGVVASPEVAKVTGDPIQDPRAYAAIESGLLYILGGYDINAVAVVRDLSDVASHEGEGLFADRCRAGDRLVSALTAVCRGDLRSVEPEFGRRSSSQPGLLEELTDDTRIRLYDELTTGVREYLRWLAGGADSIESAITRIERVRTACLNREVGDRAKPGIIAFADVYHLATVLLAALDAARERSVVHGVPPPVGADGVTLPQFDDYLRARARGTHEMRGRPLLWPSTLEYVRECLPGPHKDAVISMPTGSGKSFLAELAVAHALARGWVLYLTPTNALAHQVRRDLGRALRPFRDVTVSAFVGGPEYTTLSDEELENRAFVAVMTPEKCALALRLYPAVFKDCALCVFDECHLLNDSNRGAVADVLLAQLFPAAPNMRMLLMSAMVGNADELAEWLTTARGAPAVPSKIKWRPSRAARGFAFQDQEARDRANRELEEELRALKGANTVSRDIPIGWLVGLSGPWTRDGGIDYAVARLPITVSIEHKRSKKGELSSGVPSWKNTVGQRLAHHLAASGLPSINFVLSSRHHAFGQAGRVTGTMPGALGSEPLPALVDAQLSVADAELGVPTCLRDLLQRGIAVHTAAMLQVEQAAAERMFADEKAKLMFATGTLAQGLNLPAIAVVVSGSQVGGGAQGLADVDAAAGITRANELILNGFGRAGRPGFANQGVVVLVSDNPFFAPIVRQVDGGKALDHYKVLGEPDASVMVRSPIERFLDGLLVEGVEDDATRLELSLTSHLAAFTDDKENAGAILRRTFAGYRRRAELTEDRVALVNGRIADLKKRFLEREDVPPWMPTAAMKAGVEFFRAQRMWGAYKFRGLLDFDGLQVLGVRDLVDMLFDVLSHMPPSRIRAYLEAKKAVTPRSRLQTLAQKVPLSDLDRVSWTRPEGWADAWADLKKVVLEYMAGSPYTKLGELLGLAPSTVPGARSDAARGIPPVFKFVGEVVERALAVDAGCFVAIMESWLETERPGSPLPEALQALPLAIRNGCHTLDTLAWFRFGFRQRVCAHALADAFPTPAAIQGDKARAEFVRSKRREWLNDDAEPASALLGFARTIIRDGSSERA